MTDQQVTTKRRPFSAILIKVAVVAGILGVVLWWYLERGWSVRKVESLIGSQLPKGCGRDHAEKWFRGHAIQFEWMDGEPGDMVGPTQIQSARTMSQLAGLGNVKIQGTLRGNIPNANVDLLFNGSIWVYFFFDADGRCVGHLVRPQVMAL